MLGRLLFISVFVYVLLSLCAPGVLSNSAGVGIPCDVANPILGSPNRQRDTNRAMWWTLPPQFAGTKYTLRTGDGANVAMDLTSYTPGQYTEITIRANEQDRQFTGLLMYAENAAGQKVGQWIMPPRQPFHVDSVTGCVTHTNADPKNYKSVFRVKFPAGTGRVTIKALVKYGLAFPANEGAFYWPNSEHLVLNEGPATPQTWYQGQVGQSCNQVCAEKGLSCNLDVLRSAGSSSSLLSVASRVGSCFAPMMRACGSGSPTTGTQGCFYQDPTCTRASQQTTWVQADTCAGVPACASNTPYDKACCSYQGFKWCSKSYVNGLPEERQYGQWTKLGACAPAGGWPATPSFPNPAPRALAQADCTTVKTSAEDGARLCACGNGGPVVTDPPTPPTTQPQATTRPPQPTTQQPPQTPRPSTTAPPATRAPVPATTAPTAPPTIPPATAAPTVRPAITPPPPTTPPPISNPGNAKFILRLTSGGMPSSCWNDGLATGVFSLGMALSANSGQSWEFMDGSAGLPSVTVTFKQSITARQGGGWNTANSRTTGPNSWTFDMQQYQPSVGLILSWNAPMTCVNGRFSPEPSFSVTAVMPDGTALLVDGTALVKTGYTSLSTLSTATRVASPEEGPVAAYHGGTFGTLAVRNAVQSIQLDTSACWISNSGLINAQLTFSIRQTDSSSPNVPHVPKTETGLPRVTITFPELTSVDVTNVIQVDNSESNDISWSFDERTGQGVVGGVFLFAGDLSCREGQISPPLVYTIAGQVNGVVFPTTSTSLGFAVTALNDLGSPSGTSPSSSSSSASTSIAIIIGAAVAVAVVLIAVGAIVVHRRKRTTTQTKNTANRIQMDQTVTNHNNNNHNTKITPANQHGMQWV